MPRAELSPAARVLEFFEKSGLDTALLVLGLAQDKVRERKTRSAEAKTRAAGGAKKSHKKKTAAPPAGATVDTEAGQVDAATV